MSPTTISRRSVIEWLGKGSVVALGGSSLAACIGDVPRDERAGDGGLFDGDASGGDWNRGDTAGPATFPFKPQARNHPALEEFRVYTVDHQDLASILASWELTIDGMVETPTTLTFADLVGLTRFDPVVDFHCVTGWSVYDVPWNGVHLSTLLALASPRASASHVTFHTLGGTYNESLPLNVAVEPKTLLAYGVSGYTLPLPHGFPLRLVVPRLQAYKSAKYVHRLELTDHAVLGFWERLGYSYEAEVPSSRLRAGKY